MAVVPRQTRTMMGEMGGTECKEEGTPVSMGCYGGLFALGLSVCIIIWLLEDVALNFKCVASVFFGL